MVLEEPPVKVLFRKSAPTVRINPKIHVYDSRENIKFECTYTNCSNSFHEVGTNPRFRSRKPAANPRIYCEAPQNLNRILSNQSYKTRNVFRRVRPRSVSRKFLYPYRPNRFRPESTSSLVVCTRAPQTHILYVPKPINPKPRDVFYKPICSCGDSNQVLTIPTYAMISSTQMREQEMASYMYNVESRPQNDPKHNGNVHQGRKGVQKKVHTNEQVSVHKKKSCTCSDKHKMKKGVMWQNQRPPMQMVCSQHNYAIAPVHCIDDGPDFYRHTLGPTPDETILAGLQTVIDMCGVVEHGRSTYTHRSDSSRVSTNEDVLNWIDDEYAILEEDEKFQQLAPEAYNSEILDARRETLENLQKLVEQKSELDSKMLRNQGAPQQQTSRSNSSRQGSTRLCICPTGSCEHFSICPMTPPYPGTEVDLRASSRSNKSMRTPSTYARSSDKTIPKNLYYNDDDDFVPCECKSVNTDVRMADLTVDDGCHCSSSESDGSGDVAVEKPMVAESRSKAEAAPVSRAGGDAKSATATACDVRYAVARISKFEEYSTFEILRSTKNPPKNVPATAEGIFVLKAQKK